MEVVNQVVNSFTLFVVLLCIFVALILLLNKKK